MKRKTSWDAIDRGSVGFEDITGAANGVDQLFWIRVIHFGPQTPHHHVEDISAGLKIDPPDVAFDLLARDHLAGRAHEMREEKKFLGREMKRLPGPDRAMAMRIQFQVFDPQLIILLPLDRAATMIAPGRRAPRKQTA